MSRQVRIEEGTKMLVLPDGELYSRAVGEDPITVILSDDEWDRVTATAKASGLFTDLGALADPALDAVFATDAELAASGTYEAVDAGSNLSTARPSGAVAVYWLFDSGTDPGANGENIVNGAEGDTFYVRSA